MTAGVPKVTIDKNSNLIAGQYDIRLSRKSYIILAVSNPPLP